MLGHEARLAIGTHEGEERQVHWMKGQRTGRGCGPRKGLGPQGLREGIWQCTEAKVKSSKVQVQEGVASIEDDRMEWNKGKNGATIPEVIGFAAGRWQVRGGHERVAWP